MRKGNLIIVGGGMKASKEKILKAFIDRAGGVPRICVIAAASIEPLESYESIKEGFLKVGVKEIDIKLLPLAQIEDSQNYEKFGHEGLLPYLDDVNAVWFTGGDQLKLTDSLLDENKNDSPVLRKIREILKNGGVIGGTSAGAAIMSENMITRGGDKGSLLFPVEYDYSNYEDIFEEDSELEKMLITNGLGFLKDAIVDQHFNKRARLQRLMRALEVTNVKKGYGISEDTAMIVTLDTEEYEVLGSGYIMEVDMISKDNYQIKRKY